MTLNNKINTKRCSANVLALLLVSFCALALPLPHASAQDDKREIVKRASLSYYSLRRLGLLEFTSKVEPNWKLLTKDLGDNKAAMKVLRDLRFSVSLRSDGSVKVAYASSSPIPPSQEENVQRIYSGMTEILSGFFMTWNGFMLSSPLPAAESEYQLQELENKYFLKHKEGNADISTTMSKDFAVEELLVSTSAFQVLVRPQLAKTPGGYVLMGYQGSYETKAGAGKSELTVQIVYQEVNGLQLPGGLNLHLMNSGNPVTWEIRFTQPLLKTVGAGVRRKSN